MLNTIHPKLPMRDKTATRAFYIGQLGFRDIGEIDYPGYLMLEKDHIQVHFFEFKTLDPLQNYGQVYIRTNDIDTLYQQAIDRRLMLPAAGYIENKPWGQREFSLLDPDHNLLTFGQAL
ncbi:bleomycin resistance protein [Taibaiella helva]|uniref:bleomycin resistance protein n=1 Tax=Taibaiella helva TaxID=2301235 RepID=UPI000E57245A|nr:VOC family protein [Taibaiella helva]